MDPNYVTLISPESTPEQHATASIALKKQLEIPDNKPISRSQLLRSYVDYDWHILYDDYMLQVASLNPYNMKATDDYLEQQGVTAEYLAKNNTDKPAWKAAWKTEHDERWTEFDALLVQMSKHPYSKRSGQREAEIKSHFLKTAQIKINSN